MYDVSLIHIHFIHSSATAAVRGPAVAVPAAPAGEAPAAPAVSTAVSTAVSPAVSPRRFADAAAARRLSNGRGPHGFGRGAGTSSAARSASARAGPSTPPLEHAAACSAANYRSTSEESPEKRHQDVHSTLNSQPFPAVAGRTTQGRKLSGICSAAGNSARSIENDFVHGQARERAVVEGTLSCEPICSTVAEPDSRSSFKIFCRHCQVLSTINVNRQLFKSYFVMV